MLVAKLEVLGDIDRRGAIRFDADSPSTLRTPDGIPIDVTVENFSRTGFRFVTEVDFPIGTLVSLGLSGAGARAARIVRRRGDSYGCAFMKPLTSEEAVRAFKGQDSILSELASALEARFVSAEQARNTPMNRARAMVESVSRFLKS